jgi:hypothetical protein
MEDSNWDTDTIVRRQQQPPQPQQPAPAADRTGRGLQRQLSGGVSLVRQGSASLLRGGAQLDRQLSGSRVPVHMQGVWRVQRNEGHSFEYIFSHRAGSSTFNGWQTHANGSSALCAVVGGRVDGESGAVEWIVCVNGVKQDHQAVVCRGTLHNSSS